jgi:hypothetical protein
MTAGGKGCAPRPIGDKTAFESNWDNIFGKKQEAVPEPTPVEPLNQLLFKPADGVQYTSLAVNYDNINQFNLPKSVLKDLLIRAHKLGTCNINSEEAVEAILSDFMRKNF